jgi:Ca2+-transporting ATPase
MTAGTLMIFDAELPGGWIEGAGGIEDGRTMAFTALVLFQVSNAFNTRSEVYGALRGLFRNRWLGAAESLSVALHILRTGA